MNTEKYAENLISAFLIVVGVFAIALVVDEFAYDFAEDAFWTHMMALLGSFQALVLVAAALVFAQKGAEAVVTKWKTTPRVAGA